MDPDELSCNYLKRSSERWTGGGASTAAASSSLSCVCAELLTETVFVSRSNHVNKLGLFLCGVVETQTRRQRSSGLSS